MRVIPRRRAPTDASSLPPSRPVRQLLAPFLRGHRWKFVVIAALAFVGGFVEAMLLVLIARSALAIASRDRRFEVGLGPLGHTNVTIYRMLWLAAILVVVRMALDLALTQITVRTFAVIGRATRREMVRLFLGSTWSLQSTARQGRLQELVSNAAPAAAATGQWVTVGISAALSFTALIVTALAVNAFASLVVGVLALLLAAAFHPLRQAVRRRSRRTIEASLTLASTVAETSGLVQEIRIFEAEDAVGRMVGGRIDDVTRRAQHQQLLGNAIPTVYRGAALGLIVAALAIVYYAGFSRLSALSAVVLIMLRALGYGQALQQAIQGVHESAPNLEILTEELDRLRAAQIPRGGDPVTGIGTLTFDHVWFSYEPDEDALRDVSFETCRGDVIGIVGPSGAGKSTLMQLILRLRDPTAGRILADGRDVVDLSLDDWYHHVTYVPQDAHLFAGTVADNIRFYREGVSDGDIEGAAKLANLHDEIMARPLGYATPVGEHGGQLSGGQRQRLCIARALLEHPNVLVLDEPTSALDVKSEALIRDALGAISRDTTIFIIAHRLSTLAICDRIMVFQAGELIGFDTPARLEESTPSYREALELAGLR